MKEITSRNKGGSNSTKKWGICERDLSGGESREEGVELESEREDSEVAGRGVGAETLSGSLAPGCGALDPLSASGRTDPGR